MYLHYQESTEIEFLASISVQERLKILVITSHEQNSINTEKLYARKKQSMLPEKSIEKSVQKKQRIFRNIAFLCPKKAK